MDNSTLMIWSVLFSGIGVGYFMYGRKQKAMVPLFCGMALLVFPYFMPNLVVMLFVGAGLIALPYFVRL